jgi:glutamine amidotransferase
LDGRVVKVTKSTRLPVIGWSRLTLQDESPLWRGIADHSYFYFVHSYTPDSSRHTIASAEHSPAAAAARLNVMGTQFHPEKSGPDGLRVYENFVALCG